MKRFVVKQKSDEEDIWLKLVWNNGVPEWSFIQKEAMIFATRNEAYTFCYRNKIPDVLFKTIVL